MYNKNLKKPVLKVIIEFILYPLWDLGLKVGYAVRTYEEIILYSKKDQVIKTTILDARIIAGSKKILKNNYKLHQRIFKKCH